MASEAGCLTVEIRDHESLAGLHEITRPTVPAGQLLRLVRGGISALERHPVTRRRRLPYAMSIGTQSRQTKYDA